MPNFLASMFDKTHMGNDADQLDPIGKAYTDKFKEQEEEEQRRRQQEEQDRLKGILQGKIDAMAKAREMPSLTSADTRLAGRRAKANLLTRGGRSSTLLSGDPLGGIL